MIFNMVGGSAGGSLDINIVASLEQPINPSENTIWVKTDRTVHDVFLMPESPSSPSPNDIWVQTSQDAECFMTYSKEPDVTVGIINLFIYEGEQWAALGGGIQCGGVWYDFTVRVYGIKRVFSSPSPAWMRTNRSANFTATASVGTSAGSSDFDNCYPWSGMVRETLSTGDVMVKIPKFYYKRYRDSSYEYIQIADNPKDGFALHPAFNHGGVATDYVYVGAYKTVSGHKSARGSDPLGSLTRASFRSNAQSKGSGWGIIDISTLSAIQMLYLVEFANNNSQEMIGKGYVSDNHVKWSTGTCDSVPNLTGRAAGTDGYTSIVYRGIEDVWGNLCTYVDGLNTYGTKTTLTSGFQYYVCNDPSKYAEGSSTSYTLLSYTGGTSWIALEGLDENNSHIMLAADSDILGASSSVYYCDTSEVRSSSYVGWRGLSIGGKGYGATYLAGLFAITTDFNSDSSYYGSRLLYIPQ